MRKKENKEKLCEKKEYINKFDEKLNIHNVIIGKNKKLVPLSKSERNKIIGGSWLVNLKEPARWLVSIYVFRKHSCYQWLINKFPSFVNSWLPWVATGLNDIKHGEELFWWGDLINKYLN